jgi:SAM-dependent methyltransferase
MASANPRNTEHSATNNPAADNQATLLARNRTFYESLWGGAWLLEAQHFNTWPLVQQLLAAHPRRLEVAPGLRPRLPTADTTFIDISEQALGVLQQHGGRASSASICRLPFPDQSFDLICALDIIEHVSDDQSALSELSRVAAPGAILLLSTPLHPQWWTPFDEFVGHYRRYEPERLLSLLAQHGFQIEQSARFGMKPKSSFWVDVGMWFLKHRRKQAMWWYNRVLPYTAKKQAPLALQDGLLPTGDTGEVFLVCRKQN